MAVHSDRGERAERTERPDRIDRAERMERTERGERSERSGPHYVRAAHSSVLAERAKVNLAYRRGDFIQAKETLDQLIDEHGGEYPLLYAQRAACWIALGKYKQALLDATKSVGLCEDWRSFATLGEAFVGIGNLEQAVCMYLCAIRCGGWGVCQRDIQERLLAISRAAFPNKNGIGIQIFFITNCL